jgi:hypothetical protein
MCGRLGRFACTIDADLPIADLLIHDEIIDFMDELTGLRTSSVVEATWLVMREAFVVRARPPNESQRADHHAVGLRTCCAQRCTMVVRHVERRRQKRRNNNERQISIHHLFGYSLHMSYHVVGTCRRSD